jgi:hypothetical protein
MFISFWKLNSSGPAGQWPFHLIRARLLGPLGHLACHALTMSWRRAPLNRTGRHPVARSRRSYPLQVSCVPPRRLDVPPLTSPFSNLTRRTTTPSHRHRNRLPRSTQSCAAFIIYGFVGGSRSSKSTGCTSPPPLSYTSKSSCHWWALPLFCYAAVRSPSPAESLLPCASALLCRSFASELRLTSSPEPHFCSQRRCGRWRSRCRCRVTVQLGRYAESAWWPVESFSYFLNKFKTLQTSKFCTS